MLGKEVDKLEVLQAEVVAGAKAQRWWWLYRGSPFIVRCLPQGWGGVSRLCSVLRSLGHSP